MLCYNLCDLRPFSSPLSASPTSYIFKIWKIFASSQDDMYKIASKMCVIIIASRVYSTVIISLAMFHLCLLFRMSPLPLAPALVPSLFKLGAQPCPHQSCAKGLRQNLVARVNQIIPKFPLSSKNLILCGTVFLFHGPFSTSSTFLPQYGLISLLYFPPEPALLLSQSDHPLKSRPLSTGSGLR